MATRPRIAAVGEVSRDRYVNHGVTTLGGCSANFARAAGDAGAEAWLFAVVGDDDEGREALAALARTPLNLRVRTDPGATAICPIRVEPHGERVFCGWQPGVVERYRLTDAELAELASMDVIALANTPAWEQCMELRGPKLVGDFSQDDLMQRDFSGLALAFVGGTPADLDRLRPLARDRLVVLTAGAAGAWALHGNTVLHQPTVATQIVDTTGCGDAFQGAFTATYFARPGDHEVLARALAAGAKAAARVAAMIGAQAS
jgi:fructoselysine 6-kinase